MKICFVAQHIYSLIYKNTEIKTAGGAELQQLFIGQGLQARGYNVSYISYDYGQKTVEVNQGLKIIASFKRKDGIFFLRFFYPRLYKIWMALKKANADIYYVRCATYLPGIVALFCKVHKKKFVYAASHDTNFMPDNLRLPHKRDEFLYKYGLKRADAVIIQSNFQKKLLWENFSLDGKIIKNIYPHRVKTIPVENRDIILWVSTIREWKRPELIIGLAERFPEEHFVMIGGRTWSDADHLYEKVAEKASKVPNLQFMGYQPFEVTEKYFDRCKIFVNTSLYEGFPNTFLQAWNRCVPVISYVDPDNVIQRYKLGLVVDKERNLEATLASYLLMEPWDGNAISNYFTKYHSVEIIDEYISLFHDLLN